LILAFIRSPNKGLCSQSIGPSGILLSALVRDSTHALAKSNSGANLFRRDSSIASRRSAATVCLNALA